LREHIGRYQEHIGQNFSEKLKTGKMTFQIIDADDERNKKTGEKFQATGTALMINNLLDGMDIITDWSDPAFAMAHDGEAFIPEMKTKISTQRKQTVETAS
jgi:hypothetical protein